MGFKEILQRMREKRQGRSEAFRQLETQSRAVNTLQERQKSSNQRELEKLLKEEREEAMKEALQVMRKQRDLDIKFGHNPLNTKNIIYSDFNVLNSGHGNMIRGNILNERNLFMRRDF